MTKAQLTKKAEDLGIEVDGRWNEDRIQQEIDKKEAASKAANQAPVAPTPAQPDIPRAPNQPTGTDSTNGLPLARFAPADDAPPPEVVGITPGETPQPIQATVEPKSNEKSVKVVLDADYWPEEGDRRLAGSALDVPSSKAKELIATGKAHLPFPEDDR
jgi:hypothetical protein